VRVFEMYALLAANANEVESGAAPRLRVVGAHSGHEHRGYDDAGAAELPAFLSRA
jgi:hypothetical protein